MPSERVQIPTWFVAAVMSGLGIVIAGGFLSYVDLRENFAKVSAVLDSHHSRLDSHDRQFDRVWNRFDSRGAMKDGSPIAEVRP